VDQLDTEEPARAETAGWAAQWHVTALYEAHAPGLARLALVILGDQRALIAAVRRLPARQREALVLRYFLDMTEDQAAEVMHVSRGTVKSATSRAIAKVGRMMKEES
jgi:DNA-directed RNA polymerase specialized sigma24 family protein